MATVIVEFEGDALITPDALMGTVLDVLRDVMRSDQGEVSLEGVAYRVALMPDWEG